MKISIITSVYNGEKYIEEALESVLSQRGDFELEYIVIDALSTDKSLEKIKKQKTLVESGFYNGRNLGIKMDVISEKDNGMYDGIAKGLKKASGDIIAYINSDDFYFPGAFSCVAEILSQNSDVKWLMGRSVYYNQKGHNTFSVLRMYEDKNLIHKGAYGLFSPYYIQQESTFWRKELLKNVDLKKFAEYKRAGDFYLWHCFSKQNPLYIVNSNLAGFRTVENQLSSNIELYHDEMRDIVGSIKLSSSEGLKLQQIIDLNNQLTDLEKFEYGIFHYNDGLKKWVITENKFNLENTKTKSKKSKKFNIRSIIKSLIKKFTRSINIK